MTIDQKALTRPIVGIENRTAQEVFDIMCDRFRLAAPPAPDHADDLAVDRFADAMKAKLKWEREERGRGGWQNMSAEELSKILVDHLPKGDPVDVANLAMMLSINRQQIIMPAPDHAGLVEVVAWRVRERPGFDWRFVDGDPDRDLRLNGFEKQPLYTHPKEAEVTDSDLLAAMKEHVGWELDWGPEDRHDEESDFGWRVFERSGGRSDLEWTLLGFGETPRAALVAALSRKG